MIEIERKFRLTPDQGAELDETLQEKYGPLEPVHQVDEVFLHGMSSFATFKQGMPVARLRTVNGETQFTYKRRIDDAGDMVEHELGVSSAAAMRQILHELNYLPVTVIDKTRLEAKMVGMAIMHDQVKGLGDFCEIEIMAEDESAIPEAEARIMSEAAKLGYGEGNLEPRQYDQLVARLGQE
jgi:predicted adenylyl cyclase CyaB